MTQEEAASNQEALEREPIYGIHSDIKPENILWFDSPSVPHAIFRLGILQLADFGISTFHHTQSRSDQVLGPHTKTYRSPESELGYKTSRAFDIWSLGCVFLEFLSYVILGPEGSAFSDARLAESNSHPDRFGIAADTFYILELETARQRPNAKINKAVQAVSVSNSLHIRSNLVVC